MQPKTDPIMQALMDPNRPEALAELTAHGFGRAISGDLQAGGTDPDRASLGSDFRTNSFQTLPLTDSGNAERFEQLYGETFRYSATERCWYVWTGKRWEPDKTGRALAATKDVARALYKEAGNIEDEGRRKEMAVWARKTEASERRKAMLALAQTEGDIPITPNQWNTDPWLFNCASGTIDLRTGDLRPHNKDDRITKISPVEYDPALRSDVWEQFLRDATGDDREFIDFLQRAVGYSLTGDTREEVMFMPVGPGGTGKSTFLESFRAVMGDYARTADFETFLRRRGEGPRNDIAALAGSRMVVSSEVEEGKRLAEGVMKSITGRDTISARFLYQESFEFQPQCKLWLAANHAPVVSHTDDAIWRRIIRIPFENVVPADRRDPTLKARLCGTQKEQRAILAWAVEGCQRWREEGLIVPERIRRVTQEYRNEQNPLLDFLTDSCERSLDLEVMNRELHRAYQDWCTASGSQAINGKRFAAFLEAEGFVRRRTKSDRFWQGIGLKR